MTEVNPCGFLQNAGATHTAEQTRNWHGLLVAGKTGATTLLPRGGVNPALGNALQVTQTGSPSMAVIVKSGHATIPGSEGSKQGVYSVLNDADVTLSIGAAHATLNRIDLVCFKVQDSAYSGGVNTSSLVVVAGTPASSPAAPSAPANSIILAQVLIVANDTSISTGEITDRRQYMAATGGLISVKDSTERNALVGYESLLAWRRDASPAELSVYTAGAWQSLAMLNRGTVVVIVQRITAQSIPHNTTTALSFTGTDIYDPFGMHSTGTNPSRITVPWTGWYLPLGNVGFVANATGRRVTNIRLNGSAFQSGSSVSLPAGVADSLSIPISPRPILLNAGEYVEIMLFQNSGVALNTEIAATYEPTLSLLFLGA